MNTKRILHLLTVALIALGVYPQAMFIDSATEPEAMLIQPRVAMVDSLGHVILPGDSLANDSAVYRPRYDSVLDSLLSEAFFPDTVMGMQPLPRNFFLPAVFVTYYLPDTSSVFTPDLSGNPAMRWLEIEAATQQRMRAIMQGVVLANPSSIPYNIQYLPEPPKEFVAEVNPEDHTITIRDLSVVKVEDPKLETAEVEKRHWIRKFNASLQFSEAYVSPNWYQGGNNNVNALLNIYYNVKLNQEFHPTLLFDNTFQYKLGMNSAPDDSVHAYNISEDIFQINSVFGVKAFKEKWYYSITGQFKTQLLNQYPTNSNTMRSALLSPGELNVGLGMTYNTANAKKTFTFDASIAPISYNLSMCLNHNIDPTNYGIDPGHHYKSKFGSSAECKMMWKMAHNITYNSRVFGFTDYDRFYADWENTIVFEINKFLTTQLFWHMRYDTDTPQQLDTKWKKLQLKQILSLGFTYKFSTI